MNAPELPDLGDVISEEDLKVPSPSYGDSPCLDQSKLTESADVIPEEDIKQSSPSPSDSPCLDQSKLNKSADVIPGEDFKKSSSYFSDNPCLGQTRLTESAAEIILWIAEQSSPSPSDSPCLDQSKLTESADVIPEEDIKQSSPSSSDSPCLYHSKLNKSADVIPEDFKQSSSSPSDNPGSGQSKLTESADVIPEEDIKQSSPSSSDSPCLYHSKLNKSADVIPEDFKQSSSSPSDNPGSGQSKLTESADVIPEEDIKQSSPSHSDSLCLDESKLTESADVIPGEDFKKSSCSSSDSPCSGQTRLTESAGVNPEEDFNKSSLSSSDSPCSDQSELVQPAEELTLMLRQTVSQMVCNESCSSQPNLTESGGVIPKQHFKRAKTKKFKAGSSCLHVLQMRRVDGGTFLNVSPVVIAKTIEAIAGDVKDIERHHKGSLKMVPEGEEQTKALLRTKRVGSFPVNVSVNCYLFTPEGNVTNKKLMAAQTDVCPFCRMTFGEVHDPVPNAFDVVIPEGPLIVPSAFFYEITCNVSPDCSLINDPHETEPAAAISQQLSSIALEDPTSTVRQNFRSSAVLQGSSTTDSDFLKDFYSPAPTLHAATVKGVESDVPPDVTASVISKDDGSVRPPIQSLESLDIPCPFPPKTRRPPRVQKPWWNEECKSSLRAMRKAHKTLSKCPTSKNLMASQQARTNAKKVQSQSRKNLVQTSVQRPRVDDAAPPS